MKKFFLIPNPQKDPLLEVTRQAVDILLEGGATVYMQSPYADAYGARVLALEKDMLPKDADAIITVGGDGTVLEASRLAMRLHIPLLGINMGRMGYMAELEVDRISDLRRLLEDDYILRRLMTLRVSLLRGDRMWELPRLAVNDVVFYRSMIGHVVTLGMSTANCENEVTYMADGLIIATPIGSTAYSLSAGGPVISSDLEALCVTPICPHSFFNRSLIYGPHEVLRVQNLSSEDHITVTVDGRENIHLEPQDSMVIERAETPFSIISFEKKGFAGVLQQKMKVTG